MHHYWYADEALSSAERLPELGKRDSGTASSIVLTRAPKPLFPDDSTDWRHDWPDARGRSTLSGARKGSRYYLHVPRAAQAAFNPETGELAAFALADAAPETFRHALLDQILPRMLAQRGRLVLHGSMITTPEGRTCVMLGESGMGKSTLAGAFSCAGAQVHTDDCFIVRCHSGECSAIATYPGLRLWPDSLQNLFPDSAHQTKRMAHYCDKQRLTVANRAARPNPVPLHAILLLQRPTTPNDVNIEVDRVPSQHALVALMTNSFQMDVGDSKHVAKLFAQAGEAAKQVPAYGIRYPRDYLALPEVVKTIRTLLSNQ